MRVFGKIMKYVFIAMIAAVFLLFFFRCSLMQFPSQASELLPSDAMKEYYDQNGSLTILTQAYIDNLPTKDGRLTTYAMRYCPETGDLMITVRYNVSILTELAEEYGLASVDKKQEYFTYSLFDSNGARTMPAETDSFSKSIYQYRRFRFEGISLENVRDLAVCLHYVGDHTEPSAVSAFATAFAYSEEWETDTVPLSAADRSALNKRPER